MTENTQESLKNRLEVVKYLQILGFSVEKSKIYGDSQRGLLLVGPDGRITMENVKRYIAMAGLRKKPVVDAIEVAIAADRKLEEEIRQLELKNAKLEHELEVMRGKYVEKHVAVSELADLVALMDALPRRTLILNLPRYLTATGGAPGRAGEFLKLFGEDLSVAVDRLLANNE